MSHFSSRDGMMRRAAFAVAVFSMAVSAQSAWAQGRIFVLNNSTDTLTTYSRAATGDVPPDSTIYGFSGPHQIAIHHGAGELFITNFPSQTVSVHDMTTGVFKRSIAGPS